MLSDVEAFEVANALPPYLFLLPEGTDGDVVAPAATRLQCEMNRPDQNWCALLHETLELWHALASCPGYGAAENPCFWTRVIRSIGLTYTTNPHFDRARFFPDPQMHPFPSLTLTFGDREPGILSLGQPEYYHYDRVPPFLTQLIHPTASPRSEALRAALERIRDYVDPVRFSRPIPVHLVCLAPYFNPNQAYHDDLKHDKPTWAAMEFVEKIHDWLVQLPEECTTIWTDQRNSSAAGSSTDVSTAPRFLVDAVSVVGLHDVRDEMSRGLQSPIDDPRLKHLAFPHIGLVKIHQSAEPETVRSFLDYVLRPRSVVEPLAQHPRLPHSLTLTLTNDEKDCDLGNHVELFFQLLPFTQSIQSLTLVGLNYARQWGWLGFALFHPAAQVQSSSDVSQSHRSALKKLVIVTTNYNLRLGTLSLYREALRLRTSSVDVFKALVDGDHPLMQRPLTVWPQPPTLLEVDVATRPTTTVEHVTVTFTRKPCPSSGYTCRKIYKLTPWAEFLLTLAPSLRSFHMRPMETLRDPNGDPVCGSLPSDELLTLVDKCRHLREFAVPACGWKKQQVRKLFSITRLHAIELHATAREIRDILRVLNSTPVPAYRHLQQLAFGTLQSALSPNHWLLFETLLDRSPCLEYLSVHMGKLDQAEFREQFREHPPGAIGRRVKARCGDSTTLLNQAQQERVAFISVILHNQAVQSDVRVWTRLDSVLVGLIFQFARPRVSRFVGIDWLDDTAVIACDDLFSTREGAYYDVYPDGAHALRWPPPQ